VRGAERGAEGCGVAPPQRSDGVLHARVLGHDVTHAARERLRQGGDARPIIGADPSQLIDPERAGGFFAFAPPHAIAPARVVVRDARPDHREVGRPRESHVLGGERVRVDEQSRAGHAEAHDHRIHHADRRTDEAVLDLVGDPRHVSIVEAQREQPAQGPDHGDDERGARREPPAERHVRRHAQRGTAEDVSPAAQHGPDAAREVQPRAVRRLGTQSERQPLAIRHRAGRDLDHVVVADRRLHPRAQGEHRGQDEAAVVIGVLAHEVHATRRFGRDLGGATEELDERRELAAHAVDPSAARSSAAFSSGRVSAVKAPAPSSLPARYLRRPGMRSAG
jgi:hypothetical protein